ncbi:conserved hypothetical protein [delta proteobacterium NaphS2]|nr:conserved hypothetical protein [delta proteobacterium NaphS2]
MWVKAMVTAFSRLRPWAGFDDWISVAMKNSRIKICVFDSCIIIGPIDQTITMHYI